MADEKPQVSVYQAMVGHKALEHSAEELGCVNRGLLSSSLCGKSDHTVNIQSLGLL